MNRRSILPCAALACVFVWAGPASAHKVKVFATAEGSKITGYAYFPGGGRASGQAVSVVGPHGQKLGETRTNGDGEFAFAAKVDCDHKFVIDTGDGHRAEYTVTAQELGEGLEPSDAAKPQAGSAAPPAQPGSVQHAGDRPTAAVPPQELARMVEKAVSKQVAPLRRQIEQYQEQVRFRDVLGGIGYILGVMAIVLYLKRSRRPSA